MTAALQNVQSEQIREHMANRSIPTPESAESMKGTTPALAPSFRQRTFAAFQSSNYRLWFGGQTVSQVGTWMQTTAQGFLVFQLTHSTAYLGYVGFAVGVPALLLMLFGGVIADRFARRNLLLITQSSMMLLAFILAFLTFTELVQPWHIIVLALCLGIANAFDAPAGQAFVRELVAPDDLPNAIALNASLANVATVIGPTAAGLTYAAVGAAWCFTLNGLSFVAVIVALLWMRLPPYIPVPRTQSALVQVREGVRYALTHPLLRVLLAVPTVAVFFVAIYGTLLPAWAVEVLGGDATTNGLLQSARGAGSLCGALLLAAFGHTGRRGRWLLLGMIAYPLFVLIFSGFRWLPFSMLTLVGVGLGGSILYSMSNMLLQLHVSDELRGRVLSIYSLIMFGGMPLGALAAGTIANLIGAPLTLAGGSLIALVLAGYFWIFVPQLRRLV